jgi:hypothetical protein
MMGTLLAEQITFYQYICFPSMDFPETTLRALHTNGVILVVIASNA